jgi:hypothetical protein
MDIGTAGALGDDLVEAVERWAARALPGHSPGARARLVHSLPPPPLVRSAEAWRPGRAGMSGSVANALVTSGYHALDRAFASYLGDPPVAGWITFAKYSSRMVGSWIRLLEAWMTTTEALGSGTGALARGLAAGREFWIALGEHDIRTSAGQILRASLRGSLALSDSLRAPVIVRDALVEANTDIFSRVALAFHTFLAAEAEGGDGPEAITALVRDHRLDDPMGLLARAFDRYRAAARLGLLATAAPPGDRAMLHAARRTLVADANWQIAIQEQALIQRATIFDHPVVQGIFGSMARGGMRLSFERRGQGASVDAFTLLPEGGNWADYATRMGFEEVSIEPRRADAVVVEHGGRDRAYVPVVGKAGTILDLFSRYTDGPAGERLRRGAPRG